MIKFSKTEEYALILISVLAHNYEKKLTPLSEVSTTYSIPLLFLRNIANSLMHGGIIHAVEGKKGGYALTQDPNILTIGDVLQLFSKHMKFECCQIGKKDGACVKTDICQPTLTWWKINKEFIDKVSKLSLTDFQNYQNS